MHSDFSLKTDSSTDSSTAVHRAIFLFFHYTENTVPPSETLAFSCFFCVYEIILLYSFVNAVFFFLLTLLTENVSVSLLVQQYLVLIFFFSSLHLYFCIFCLYICISK